MGSQIIFFEKNKADISNANVSATASQGATFAEFALNRSNASAWATTNSVDADNTTFEVDFGGDLIAVSEILLIKNNFKNFTIKYWDGAAYQNFSTPIAETTNTLETNRYSFTTALCYKILITIYGTQTANEDKFLYQFIATEQLGKLQGWPVIKNPIHSKNKKISKMLSGKSSVSENVGAFACQLQVKEWRIEADLVLVETLYESTEGFLVWLCGGVETQFFGQRQGYRLEDLLLMRCKNDYEPEYVQGMYTRGLDLRIDLIEVVD